ncbi:MAG TPA: dihydrofolate reductase family protein, partial [Pyrinomonadaceae bacterium]|nr:dihydrofolate reductase family protein [Pyrinomonadaceae bacterium]
TRTGDSRWITGEPARRRVQELRHECDAILIGAGTALADDPLLTDRSGLRRRRALVRVVLDESLRLSPLSQLAQTAREFPLLVFTARHADKEKVQLLKATGAEIVNDHLGGRNLQAVLEALGQRSLQSLLVEGGANVAGAFMDAGLVDKVTFFIAPMIIGGRDAVPAMTGVGAEKIADAYRLSDVEMRSHASDLEITGYPEKQG